MISETGATVRDSRYDVLFEPVQLGPVRAKNRFFQVPHCNGMGYRDPTAQAAMRNVKAEGGWAVVCTEQVEIHPSSDITPFIELRLWDDGDLPALARIADAIHAGGALAGIELAHNGMNAPNLSSREPPLGPAHLPVVTWSNDPVPFFTGCRRVHRVNDRWIGRFVFQRTLRFVGMHRVDALPALDVLCDCSDSSPLHHLCINPGYSG